MLGAHTSSTFACQMDDGGEVGHTAIGLIDKHKKEEVNRPEEESPNRSLTQKAPGLLVQSRYVTISLYLLSYLISSPCLYLFIYLISPAAP